MSDETPQAAPGLRELVALRDYSAPAMPTEHAIRRYWRLLRRHFKQDESEPMSAGERLKPATRKLLDSVAAPPAYGVLMEELQSAVQAWQADAAPGAAWMQAVVLAPCDHSDLVGTWAEQHDHAVLRPPARDALAHSAAQIDWELLAGDGLLVVPQLERWFLRQRDGLVTVRGLIEALSQLERPCIVSCNSWAWAFLEKAAGAGLVLPRAVTFQAFRAKQLNAWFTGLAQREAIAGATIWHGALGPHTASPGADNGGETAQSDAPSDAQADLRTAVDLDLETHAAPGRPLVFRLASTGADVLTEISPQDHDADEANHHDEKKPRKPRDGYLRRLAARSLGIPWVAWSLWRDGLQAAADTDQVSEKIKQTVQDDGRTLWVSNLPEFSLPLDYERPALLVAHALLLHGALTRSQLQGVLPAQEQPGVLAALLSAGYLEWADSGAGQMAAPQHSSPHEDQRVRAHPEREVRVRASAYPALHTALKTAGFPTGAF